MNEELVKRENYPDWADKFDEAIISIILNSQKSMSINTLKNRFLKRSMNFDERLTRISEMYPAIKRWEQKKPTPQIGTEEHYKEAQKEMEMDKE